MPSAERVRPVDSAKGPWHRSRTAGYRLARRFADRLGVHLVRKRFTSPIPILEDLPADLWDRRSALVGVEFDAEAQLAFVASCLSPYLAEFEPPLDRPQAPDEYFVSNGFYQGVDAQLLYGMLRHFRPRRVIELGSGYSSMVIAAATTRNADDGVRCKHTIIDPYPSGSLSPGFWEQRELLETKVEDLPVERFSRSLSAGDVLVVDTSHAVRLGGDVTFIVLDVLPALREGVVVHFHDIFIPWHYPRAWFEDEEWYWAEQYLIQAFLAFNVAYEVLVSAHLLARTYPEQLAELATLARHSKSEYECQSLWLRRVGRGAQDRHAKTS